MCVQVSPLHGPLVAHLRGWQPTATLGELRINALAQELLSNVLRRVPLQAEQWQFDGVRGLRRQFKGIPVAYLSSHIVGHDDRVKKEGGHKIITQGLRLAWTAQGISAICIAIAKPRRALDAVLLQREIGILKRCAQEDCSGMIRLIDGVEYAKGGRMKTRMMLPWYAEGNLLQALDSLSPEERFSICHQLFQIVRGLEAKGWVYRDLKGDNILISHDAEGKVQVTLCDAGAMHKRGLGSAPQLMGPSEFMAPEYAYVKTEACQELRQSLVLQFTTSKLDVWGCGVLVAGLLVPAVYQKLFPDEHSAKESSQWYQEGEIPVLEALDPSSLWHRFLQRVLNPCPDRRLSPEEALSQFEALFVVGRPPADGDGSVDLLEKQEAGHLVGEGHRGERQLA